jgi:glycosyltransferase involved in cell wall biosynthesis
MSAAAPTTFAVVVTCYNYRDFVVEAVDSALAQTRAPKHVIVVDDGSKDGSQDLLRERYGDDPRVTLLMCENGGQLVAFQRGLAATDADVVCFLDADDRFGPDYLAKLGGIFDQRRDVDFVFSDIIRFGSENKRVGDAATVVDYGYTAIATYALAHWYGGPTSALSIRRDCCRICLAIPEEMSPRWKLCADAVLVYGASLMGARKIFVPTGDVFYRVHGKNGWWSNRSDVADYRNRLRARELIEYFAARAGLHQSSLESVKYEFRTKPAVSRTERRRYINVAMMSPGPLWKRLERALGVAYGKSKHENLPSK